MSGFAGSSIGGPLGLGGTAPQTADLNPSASEASAGLIEAWPVPGDEEAGGERASATGGAEFPDGPFPDRLDPGPDKVFVVDCGPLRGRRRSPPKVLEEDRLVRDRPVSLSGPTGGN